MPITYQPFQIVNKAGNGSGVAHLTTSYTPGSVVSSGGMSSVSIVVAVGIGGSTTTSVRLMNYSGATPTELQTTLQTDVSTTSSVHSVTVAGSFTLSADLGGTVAQLALECLGTGSLTGSDTVTATIYPTETR